MAIPGQANINIGAENQVAGSDNLYEAFHTIQNNFTTLFNASSTLTTFRAGEGIQVSANASNGVVDINNTGVTKITAGTGVTISSANGNVTISTAAQGQTGVTRVGLTSSTLNVGGVSGSNVVSSGTFTVDLPRVPTSSSFATGSYIAPNVTVDEFGRVTAIANGVGVGTVTSVGINPGKGIAVTGGPIVDSGAIDVINTGVTSLQAGTGIRLSGSNGDITVSALQVTSGTVTQIGLTSNTLSVTDGTVTSSGTINVELPVNLSSNNLILSGNANVSGNVNTYKLVSTFSNVQTDLTIGGGPSPGSLTFKTQNNSGNYVSLIPPVNTAVAGLVFMLPNTLGSNSQVLGTDGAGTMNWRIPPAAGTNTQIQFNDPASNGAPQLAGHANLTFNKNTGLLTSQQLSVTANANVGNLSTSGTVTASRFISNVATGTTPFTVTSTTMVTNLYSQYANSIVANAQPNITSVGRLSSLTVGNATANVVLGNSTITTSDITASNAFVLTNTASLLFNTQTSNTKFTALQPPDTILAGAGLYANGTPGGNAFMFWNLPNTWGNVNQFLTTDGSGTMQWSNVPASSPGFDGANIIAISNTTVSTTTTTGALTVGGGVGVEGNVNVGGNLALATGGINVGGGNLTVTQTGMLGARNLTLSSGANISGDVNFLAFSDVRFAGNIAGNVSFRGDYFNFGSNAVISGGGYITSKDITVNGRVEATGNITSSSYVDGQYVKASTALYVYGQSQLGNVGNVYITGGTSGQVLSTDGTGNLSWISASSGGGSSFDASQQLTITNTNTSTSYITGAVRVAGGMGVIGNINAGGNVTSTITASNITGNVSYSSYSGAFTNTTGEWMQSGLYYDGTNIIINERFWKDPIGFAQVKSAISNGVQFGVDPGGYSILPVTPSGDWVEQTMYGAGIWTITVGTISGVPSGTLAVISISNITLNDGGLVSAKLVSGQVLKTALNGQLITNKISSHNADVTISTFDVMFNAYRKIYLGGFGSATIALDDTMKMDSQGIIQRTNGNITIMPNIQTADDNIIMSPATVSAKFVATIGTTFSALSNQGTPAAGQRAFITDGDLAAAGNFGAVVGGGGSNGVPVYYDGSTWRIG